MAQTQQEVQASLEMLDRKWKDLKDVKKYYAVNPPKNEMDLVQMQAVLKVQWGSYNVHYQKLERYFLQKNICQVMLDLCP